ncbi:MAG: putative glycolipid-binding domain-containing protein [Pseudomonadota bacterium]
MATRHIATARWRALDREGEDSCRLSQTDDGWILLGHARFRDVLGMASLNYVVRCDSNWITQSVDLAGQHEGNEVRAKMINDGGTWWIDDRKQDGVAGALDIDLSFTPATNLMPLRRLGTVDLAVSAAWLQYPCAKLVPLDQTYGRTDLSNVMQYQAKQTGFATEITVDQSGFVTRYPGFWEGEVERAD